jgi:hypothetical protein
MCKARRSTRSGPCDRHRPLYDHITSAIATAMIGWYGASMLLLRDAQDTWGCRTARM